jgi:hypothetical protein
MSDWNDLAAAWRTQPVDAAVDEELISRAAARASREARAWRWCWNLVQASVVAAVVLTISVWWRKDASPMHWIITGLSALSVVVWGLSRSRMRAVLDRPTLSALDHLRAERARAASVPWFVAVDFVVYALLAAMFAWVTWAWHGDRDLLGVAWGERDPAGLVLIWLLLGAATVYDIVRLARSRRRRRELDALLAALERDAPP